MSVLKRMRKFWTRSEIAAVEQTGAIRDTIVVGQESRESMGGSPETALEALRGTLDQNTQDGVEALEGRAGMASDNTMDTGDQLAGDVDEHVGNLERWKEEDRKERDG